MNFFKIVLGLLLAIYVSAHDEGHGPALKDESLYGGKVSGIIAAKEIKKGPEATLIYKAELVYNSKKEDIKLYIYNAEMKPIDLSKFVKKAHAVLIEKKSEVKFNIELDESGTFFKGVRPKNKRVPFNIDVYLKENDSELFGAFDNLD